MGQYYKFMNLDKKQVCQQNWRNIKLTEHSYIGNYYCMDILTLLNNEWKGDRVIHVGDYANVNDRTTTQKIVRKITASNNLKMSLYDWADTFDDVAVKNRNDKIRYVYNHSKKEYVDLYKQPVQWCHYDNNVISFSKFNSFALLTGCGNGQGGGDYRRVNFNSVGSWAGDSLESSVSFIDEYKKYRENKTIFNEMLKLPKSVRKWNCVTEQIIGSKEAKELSNYVQRYREYYNMDMEKLDIDISELTPTETVYLTNELCKIKEKYKNKEEDICL